MRNLGVVVLCAVLGGCAAQANTTTEDPQVWGRVDCVRLLDNPIAQQEFDQAKAICLSRGQAAGLAGTAGMPGGYGLGGAIAAGINQGVTAGAISSSTAASCLGELGYMLRTKSEHLAACAAIKEQRDRMAAQVAAPQAKRASNAKPRRAPVLSPDTGAPSPAKPGT